MEWKMVWNGKWNKTKILFGMIMEDARNQNGMEDFKNGRQSS